MQPFFRHLAYQGGRQVTVSVRKHAPTAQIMKANLAIKLSSFVSTGHLPDEQAMNIGLKFDVNDDLFKIPKIKY